MSEVSSKEKYLSAIKSALSHLSREDVKERIAFYSEMIDDRVEDGLTEDEAIREIGSVRCVVDQITAELAARPTTARAKKPRQRRGVGYIILVICASVIWLPLLIAGVAVAVSLFVSLWAIVISLWAVLWSVAVSLWAAFVAFIGASLYGIVGGALALILDGDLLGIAIIGAGAASAGLSILSFFAARSLCAVFARLTVWSAVITAKLPLKIFRRK